MPLVGGGPLIPADRPAPMVVVALLLVPLIMIVGAANTATVAPANRVHGVTTGVTLTGNECFKVVM